MKILIAKTHGIIIAPPNDPSGFNDFDYRIIWGNQGTIKIQRPFLRKIKYYLRCWNSKDDWVERENEQVVNPPTSLKHTFYQVTLLKDFTRNTTNEYRGRRYIMEGKIEIYYGETPGETIDVVVTTVSGCLRRYDPHYEEIYSGCIPVDIPCEEN